MELKRTSTKGIQLFFLKLLPFGHNPIRGGGIPTQIQTILSVFWGLFFLDIKEEMGGGLKLFQTFLGSFKVLFRLF